MRYVKGKSKAKSPLKIRVVNKKLEDCVGQCYPGYNHMIEIDPRQSPQDYMDTLIHETIHELFPKMKEPKVLHAATTITNLLWKLSYRRPPQ